MRRLDLVPDCGSCAALCCVATSFEASPDFAIDKPAGVPCSYLKKDCRCAIHDELALRGFSGCTVFDCHGAGQRATRAFDGVRDAALARNAAFLNLLVIHELLWALTETAELCSSLGEVAALVAVEIDALDALARGPREAWMDVDLRAQRTSAKAALRRAGEALGGRMGAARVMAVAGEKRRLRCG